jgi:glycosyltransferase involved in cell wall biosynthesis
LSPGWPGRVRPQGSFGSGQDNLPRLLASQTVCALITLGDPWEFAPVAKLKQSYDFVWVAYVPTDAGPLPIRAVGYLEQADAVVAPTHYGRRVLTEALSGLEVCVAYHGVDSTVIRPLHDRVTIRDALGLGDRFVVGYVGKNQPRKQIPALVKGFAQFAAWHEDAFLYLHTDQDPRGWHVPDLIARHGLVDRTIVTPSLSVSSGLPDERLNELYNAFDVFVLPSSGEGFGLPLLEAMAAGVPVVTTNESSNRELAEGRGLLIDVKTFITGTALNLEIPLPDEEDIAAKLEMLYRDPDLRAELAAQGRRFAEEWPWERSAAALAEVCERAIRDRRTDAEEVGAPRCRTLG